MKTPEDIALELITQWLNEVDPQVFMEEFNSLGKGKGITIGEYLAQSEFQYADLEHEKVGDGDFVTLLESEGFVYCSREVSALFERSYAFQLTQRYETVHLLKPVLSDDRYSTEYDSSLSVGFSFDQCPVLHAA